MPKFIILDNDNLKKHLDIVSKVKGQKEGTKPQVIYLSKDEYKKLKRKATPRAIKKIKKKIPNYKTSRGRENAIKRMKKYQKFWNYQNYLVRKEQWKEISNYEPKKPNYVYKIKG